jgi:hypothetical protein
MLECPSIRALRAAITERSGRAMAFDQEKRLRKSLSLFALFDSARMKLLESFQPGREDESRAAV